MADMTDPESVCMHSVQGGCGQSQAGRGRQRSSQAKRVHIWVMELFLLIWQEAEQRKGLLHRFPRRPREGQKRTWKEDTESCDYVRVSVRCFPGCALGDSLGSMGLLGEVGLHFLSDQWQLTSTHAHARLYHQGPSIPESALLMQPRTETPDIRLRSHSTSRLRSPQVNLSSTGGPPGAQEVPITDTPLPARQPCVRVDSLVVEQRAKRPCRVSLEGPQAGSKGHGLGHTQAPPKYPEENTRPAVSNALADNSQMLLQTPGKKCAQMPQTGPRTPERNRDGAPASTPPGSLQKPLWGFQGVCVVQEADVPVDAQPGPGSPGRHLPSGHERAPSPHLPHLTWRRCSRAPSPHGCPLRGPPQPLRMVFTRLDRSCWSSRFLAAPSFLPPEKPGPAQGSLAPHMSDGACVCGPWSVLHGDLQVSSSSEDSESE
ncbi:protein FAM90A20-like [Lycaon pictus]